MVSNVKINIHHFVPDCKKFLVLKMILIFENWPLLVSIFSNGIHGLHFLLAKPQINVEMSTWFKLLLHRQSCDIALFTSINKYVYHEREKSLLEDCGLGHQWSSLAICLFLLKRQRAENKHLVLGKIFPYIIISFIKRMTRRSGLWLLCICPNLN